VSFLRFQKEQGSGLVWFISLLALISVFIGTLVAASSQFLLARQVTDFTEQYALSLKTLLNQNPSLTIETLSRKLSSQVSSNYSVPNLFIKSVSLEKGRTVHTVVCVTWRPPIVFVDGTREICEEAYAR
jgi:hypothetical protein